MKTFHTTLLSLIITAIINVTAQAPVASISSAETSKCLDVKNSRFQDGTAAVINTCNNSIGQLWEIFSGLTEIILNNPKLKKRFCLDAKTVDEDSSVVIWECNQNPWQQWILTDDGLITLANNTNLCLEVPSHSKIDGTQLQTYTCNGGLNQIWNLD